MPQPPGFVPDGFVPDAPAAQPTTADLLAGRMIASDKPNDLKDMLQSAAYPTKVTDALTYIVPSVGEGALPYYASAAKQAWNEAPTLRSLPGKLLKILGGRAMDTTSDADRALQGFNKLPLAQQMERLPETGPMQLGRIGNPPMQPPPVQAATSAQAGTRLVLTPSELSTREALMKALQEDARMRGMRSAAEGGKNWFAPLTPGGQ